MIDIPPGSIPERVAAARRNSLTASAGRPSASPIRASNRCNRRCRSLHLYSLDLREHPRFSLTGGINVAMNVSEFMSE